MVYGEQCFVIFSEVQKIQLRISAIKYRTILTKNILIAGMYRYY